MEGDIYFLNRDNAALHTSNKVLEEMIVFLEEERSSPLFIKNTVR